MLALDKKKISCEVAKKRGFIQALATLFTNPHVSNFSKGSIYTGKAKSVCVPGLNSYSCPAATGLVQLALSRLL